MRKKLKTLRNKIGKTRIIKKFLWFPTTIGFEWRWLETAKIIQQVTQIDTGGSGEWGVYDYKWLNMRWKN